MAGCIRGQIEQEKMSETSYSFTFTLKQTAESNQSAGQSNVKLNCGHQSLGKQLQTGWSKCFGRNFWQTSNLYTGTFGLKGERGKEEEVKGL